DRKIALAARLIALQQGFQQVEEPLQEGLIGGVGSQIFAYRCVATGQATQLLLPVRIVEKAHIEHEVRLPRQAEAVGEGGDENLHASAAVEPQLGGQKALQLNRWQVGGIEHAIGDQTQGLEQHPFG